MKFRQHGKQKAVAKLKKSDVETQPIPPISDEDSQSDGLECSISLPDFKFLEFAGLDGFDRRNCVWIPQPHSDSENSNVGDNSEEKYVPPAYSYEIEDHQDFNPIKKFSRKNNFGHCSCTNGTLKDKSSVTFPQIHNYGGSANVSKRCSSGQLVYESPRNACKEDFLTKMDKIKAFAGARNSSHKLHTGKSCSLPPLNGVVRLSSSVHCQPFNSTESMLRKNYVAYKIKSLGAFAKENSNAPVLPWKGRSFPRLSASVTQNLRDGISTKKSLVKKCGGGGYATALGRTAIASFASQQKSPSVRKSRSGEPRAPLKPFRF